MPGPQISSKNDQKKRPRKRSSLKFRPIFCPKLGEDQKKKVFTEIKSHFFPKLDEDQKKHQKNLTRGPELFRGPLSPALPAPGPATMYPLNPLS